MRLICGLYRLDGGAVELKKLDAMAVGMIAAPLQPELRRSVQGHIGLAVLDFAAAPGTGEIPSMHGAIVAADHRLDAPDELATRLDSAAMDPDRLIAHAIDRWGSDAPDQLLGDFALAHWDPTASRLLCARDIFGVRPFYYVWRPAEVFAFASFPAGLHAAGVVPRTFDRQALARHLLQQQRPDEALFSGISRLPPAHVLEVSPAGLSVRRYWSPGPGPSPRERPTPEAAPARMHALLEQAISSRLPPSGEVATHLSGGLDSSAITTLAARQVREKGGRVHAWSFLDVQRNDITLEDETEAVQAVLAQEPGISWSAVRPPRDDIDPGRFHPDLPLPIDVDSSDCAVCAGAAAAGIGTILSGWGGDEAVTFNGRGALAEHLLKGRWRTLMQECRAIARDRGTGLAAVLRSEVFSYLMPDSWHAARSRRRGDGLRDQLARCLADDLADLANDREGLLPMGPDAVANRLTLIGSPHIAQRCEQWAAQGARYGVAFAFPMLDRRLVEYALTLPSGLFARGGWKRRVFRDAMQGVLPDVVRKGRTKATPFPAMPLIMSEQKAKLAARIEAAATHADVRGLFDMDSLRAQVANLPDAETVKAGLRGNATPAAHASALRQMLRMVAFMAQDQ